MFKHSLNACIKTIEGCVCRCNIGAQKQVTTLMSVVDFQYDFCIPKQLMNPVHFYIVPVYALTH